MKLAAIDIGSNAIRLLVTKVLFGAKNKPIFKRIEYIRFPLRLGNDVFTKGYISDEKRLKFLQLMQTFKLLTDLYEVDHYLACATSAMRESTNGAEIIKEVKQKVGLSIKLIDGETEANHISSAIAEFLKEKTILHVDVGGGSTELNFYTEGKKIASQSFKIGSVRLLEHYDTPDTWINMKKWIITTIKKRESKVITIGTGGNINKLFDLINQKTGKTVSLKQLQNVTKLLRSYNYEERQYILQLNADRADVIIPASEIYIAVMEWAGASTITVPKVGLKDGLLLDMYSRVSKK